MLYSPAAPSYFEISRGGAENGSAGANGLEGRNLSVRALVETACPSLMEDFKPSWWLPG